MFGGYIGIILVPRARRLWFDPPTNLKYFFERILCQSSSSYYLSRHKMTIYKEKLLPRHPPLLPEWFMRTFPDPTSWYSARVSYARTTAVMSIVGYILGLGDRHGENILFDSHTGDCVHVDFNCLFNKVYFTIAIFLILLNFYEG